MQRAAVVVLLIVLTVAGCTREGAVQRAPSTLIVAMAQEPVALDPLLLEGKPAYAIGDVFYSYLTNYDAGGRIAGDLAREVPTVANGGISKDGTRITFHLRHDARWQDGTPVTAADVVFSYRAVMNPANNVQTRYPFELIGSVRAPDPYTVVVTLKRPFSPMISWFFGGDDNYPILPAHLLARLPNLNAVPFNAAPVGSGPYKLDRWDHGDRLVLAANDAYYGGTPRIAHLIVPFITNDSTTIGELQSGEIDAAFLLDASRIGELRAIPNHRVVVTPVPYFYAIGFNLSDPLLADHTVREAFALAIDRRSLTRKISQGVYDAGTAMRGLFSWAFDPAADTMRYDPARARQLLHGRKIHVELSFATGNSITTRFATAIAEEEHAVGIDVSLRQYDRTQFVSLDGPWMQGRYQVSLYDYQATYDPDASWILACSQRAPHGFNLSRYCNPRVDALLERAASSYDRAARIAAYGEIQRQIAEDLPLDFLCQISEVDVIPATLGGYAPPLLSPFRSVASWYWETAKS